MQKTMELLAPAGHWDALKAAIENGADAVYFGVQGYNARARAANFLSEELPEILSTLHAQGVKGYLTLNTLIFPSELKEAAKIVEQAARSGVDALIVQDMGLAKLAGNICPELPVHASTQMTVTSASGVRHARSLGCQRVILARELSVSEIAEIHHQEPDMPLEVFVHGALCVAYSGQCLTSEALGGRSANRGECAQACRMPYEMFVDGEHRDLGDKKYLLSPQDLAAYALIPELAAAGVVSFKIEGRLKSAEYVANVTGHYRKAIDACLNDVKPEWSREDKRRIELAFSRGLSHGFLDGNNHKLLVRGDFSNKRGPHVGFIEKTEGHSIIARLHLPVKAGDGLMIDVDENDQGKTRAVGGRVFQIEEVNNPKSANNRRQKQAVVPEISDRLKSGRVRLRFMRDSADFSKILPGQAIWQTDDQALNQKLKETYARSPKRKNLMDLEVKVFVGKPLELLARVSWDKDNAVTAKYIGQELLQEANHRPADVSWVGEHLGKLGDTTLQIGELKLETDGRTLVPASLLNQARRELVIQIMQALKVFGQSRKIGDSETGNQIRNFDQIAVDSVHTPTGLTCLVRDFDQLRSMNDLGIETVYADFQDIREYREACRWSQANGIRLWLASPRIEKPGEFNLFRYLEKCQPEGILVRNAGGVEFCRSSGMPWIADFSLNITNSATAQLIRERGAQKLTAGFDLNISQLMELVDSAPASWFEVVIHQRVAMFHMEHCVFCMVLTPGTDKSNCGRPCDRHTVHLEDRVGVQHRLTADVGCRNTLFHAQAQSAAEFMPRLKEKHVASLRLEFVDESPELVQEVVRNYQAAMTGTIDPRTLWRRVRATNQYGLTRGTLQIVS